MAELRPFRALRFSRPAGPRLAPPYDVISPEDRERLAAEPENVVHLTLPEGGDWAAARRTLERWIRDGVLERDAGAQLYRMEEVPDEGPPRRGFLGLLRLADYSEKVVLPHERTTPGPKRRRLELTREVQANLEPLFFLYRDPGQQLGDVIEAAGRGAALLDAPGPAGNRIRLHGLADPGAIRAVQSFLDPQKLVIADGHHRYETMLEYRAERRRAAGAVAPDAGYEFVLAYLVNAADPGSRIGPIHRVVRGAAARPGAALERCGFACEPVRGGAEALLAELAARGGADHAFIVASGADLVLARAPRRDGLLDVEVLHQKVLNALGGEVAYDAEPGRVLAAARAGAVGILLRPLDDDTLFKVVEAGTVLPPKSTYFTPKVPSGVVLRDL